MLAACRRFAYSRYSPVPARQTRNHRQVRCAAMPSVTNGKADGKSDHRPDSGLKPGQLFALAGLAFAGLALWVGPLILGPLGILFGAAADVRGERRGRWVAVAALCGLGLGLLVSSLPA